MAKAPKWQKGIALKGHILSALANATKNYAEMIVIFDDITKAI